MTNPSPPGGRDVEPTLRLLTAVLLLAIAAVVIVFGFIQWVFPAAPSAFWHRFWPDPFISLLVLAAPLLAVLVATRLPTPLPQAKLLSLLAMLEYAAAFVLGTLGFLLSLGGRFENTGRDIYGFGAILQNLGHILVTLLQLGLVVLLLLWTYLLFRGAGGRLPGPLRRLG